MANSIKGIAACHRLCFADSLSGRLSTAYTCKTFHWFLAGNNRFLLHVSDDQQNIIGYCGGFIPQYAGDGSTSGIMRYAMREACISLIKNPSLLFDPELRKMYPLALKNIRRKLFSSKEKYFSSGTNEIIMPSKAGLVVIGVRPSHRGRGILEQLMQGFEEEMLKRQIPASYLSVKKTNIRAVNGYKKLGWRITKEHTDSFEMEKALAI